jgi:hypothetical protein
MYTMPTTVANEEDVSKKSKETVEKYVIRIMSVTARPGRTSIVI